MALSMLEIYVFSMLLERTRPTDNPFDQNVDGG